VLETILVGSSRPKAYGYMNNPADAKSVANAIELEHLLKEAITGDYNPELLKRYPELKAIVPAPAKRELLVPVRTA
jgi:hypothetical protein